MTIGKDATDAVVVVVVVVGEVGEVVVVVVVVDLDLDVVVVVRTNCNAQVSVHLRSRVHFFKSDQCQCTGPFGWTDQPEPTAPVAYGSRFQASPAANSTNPKARKKVARRAHLSPSS